MLMIRLCNSIKVIETLHISFHKNQEEWEVRHIQIQLPCVVKQNVIHQSLSHKLYARYKLF
jgi:hypothetical protein